MDKITKIQKIIKDYQANTGDTLGFIRELMSQMVDIYDWKSNEMESNELESKLNGKCKSYILSVKILLEPNQVDDEYIKAMKVMILNNEVRELSDMIEYISPKLALLNHKGRIIQEKMKTLVENLARMGEWSLNNQVDVIVTHSEVVSIASDIDFVAKQMESAGTDFKEVCTSIRFKISEVMTKLKQKMDLLEMEKGEADLASLKLDS